MFRLTILIFAGTVLQGFAPSTAALAGAPDDGWSRLDHHPIELAQAGKAKGKGGGNGQGGGGSPDKAGAQGKGNGQGGGTKAADCSGAGAKAQSQTGGQVLSVNGGGSGCSVTVLVPGEQGGRPRKQTITVQP